MYLFLMQVSEYQIATHVLKAIAQLVQLPLIALGRLPAIRRNKLMGNVVFWLGLYAGFPLLCVGYVGY
jgi:sterol O-acyltransferase